jgi:hypothetical protein
MTALFEKRFSWRILSRTSSARDFQEILWRGWPHAFRRDPSALRKTSGGSFQTSPKARQGAGHEAETDCFVSASQSGRSPAPDGSARGLSVRAGGAVVAWQRSLPGDLHRHAVRILQRLGRQQGVGLLGGGRPRGLPARGLGRASQSLCPLGRLGRSHVSLEPDAFTAITAVAGFWEATTRAAIKAPWAPLCFFFNQTSLVGAGAAKATSAALALIEAFNHIEAHLKNGHDHHLGHAVHGLDGESLA